MSHGWPPTRNSGSEDLAVDLPRALPAGTAPLPCETSSQVLQGTQVDNREQAQNVQLDNNPSKVRDLLKQQAKQFIVVTV